MQKLDFFVQCQSGTQITSLNLKRLSVQPFVYRLYMNASSQRSNDRKIILFSADVVPSVKIIVAAI